MDETLTNVRKAARPVKDPLLLLQCPRTVHQSPGEDGDGGLNGEKWCTRGGAGLGTLDVIKEIQYVLLHAAAHAVLDSRGRSGSLSRDHAAAGQLLHQALCLCLLLKHLETSSKPQVLPRPNKPEASHGSPGEQVLPRAPVSYSLDFYLPSVHGLGDCVTQEEVVVTQAFDAAFSEQTTRLRQDLTMQLHQQQQPESQCSIHGTHGGVKPSLSLCSTGGRLPIVCFGQLMGT